MVTRTGVGIPALLETGHPFFGLWCLHLSPCQIMVVRAGQPSGWPVSNKAGIPTPVWATTHERRNSGGSSNRYLLEIVLMTTALTAAHPEFTFIFAAVRRNDAAALPCIGHADRVRVQQTQIVSVGNRVGVMVIQVLRKGVHAVTALTGRRSAKDRT